MDSMGVVLKVFLLACLCSSIAAARRTRTTNVSGCDRQNDALRALKARNSSLYVLQQTTSGAGESCTYVKAQGFDEAQRTALYIYGNATDNGTTVSSWTQRVRAENDSIVGNKTLTPNVTERWEVIYSNYKDCDVMKHTTGDEGAVYELWSQNVTKLNPCCSKMFNETTQGIASHTVKCPELKKAKTPGRKKKGKKGEVQVEDR
uniref:Lipocalin n=1 Tax=Argas monolakensis TaxID=34602 RepID=Q09JS0_ARGMO|nr:lipocalin [Argas monolakensis]